jgi:hypothetical protein
MSSDLKDKITRDKSEYYKRYHRLRQAYKNYDVKSTQYYEHLHYASNVNINILICKLHFNEQFFFRIVKKKKH